MLRTLASELQLPTWEVQRVPRGFRAGPADADFLIEATVRRDPIPAGADAAEVVAPFGSGWVSLRLAPPAALTRDDLVELRRFVRALMHTLDQRLRPPCQVRRRARQRRPQLGPRR
jgi:hypothetical protein